MVVSNQKQMVFSCNNCITLTNGQQLAACDVSSVDFNKVRSSYYRLILQ